MTHMENSKKSWLLFSVAIGGTRLHINGSGELQFTTSYIHVPPDAFPVIISAVQAEYDDENGAFFVDCNERELLPDIVLSLPSGLQYAVPPQDYAREVSARR